MFNQKEGKRQRRQGGYYKGIYERREEKQILYEYHDASAGRTSRSITNDKKNKIAIRLVWHHEGKLY